MLSLPTLFFIALFFLETLAAMLQNGFMVVVLGWEWARGHRLPTGDTILACLAASRFSLHGSTFTNNFLMAFEVTRKVHYFGTLWDFSNTLTFWLTALLSVFYCLKIASFSHPAFLWLRWRLSRAVPGLLLGCVAVSLLTSIPLTIGNITVTRTEVSQPPGTNASWAERARTVYESFFLLHEVLALSAPFLLFLVSTTLLMFSLRRHLCRMRYGWHGPRDPSTQVHTMALKSLGFFLLFGTSFFLSLLVASMNRMPPQQHWFWVWQMVTYAGMALHSTFLLFSRPRLRRALKVRL